MPKGSVEFYAALEKFLAELTTMFQTHRSGTLALDTEEGSKFVKIITRDGQASVYAFVQKETGDIYKPASYKSPTLNFTRGNIYSDETRMSWCGPYGLTTKMPGRPKQVSRDPGPDLIDPEPDPLNVVEEVAKRFVEKGIIKP